MKKIFAMVIIILVFCLHNYAGFDFSKIKERVSEFTLDNGLKFILIEDHSVPIASFVTYVNIGGSDERIGIYGISHFLEHMAFKGTSEIGTKDYQKEKKILFKMDQMFERILKERDSLKPDQDKIKKLNNELEELRKEAAKYVVQNEFDKILKRNGGVGLNAGTSKDATIYFFSLPSNKVELWAYLESSRFIDPVFREFYKERDVIQEERRVRTENSPIGKLIEEFQAVAFKDHPYKVSVVGPMSNIRHISRADMKSYFRTGYTARNMVIGVAGDVYPEQLKKLAKKYFAKMRPGRKNPRVFTIEPPQLGEKTVTIYEESQPWLILGYHFPSVLHKDFTKFSLLNNILTSGRSSRLYKKMVSKDKSALAVFSFAGYPGNKYASLYLVAALPNSGHKTDELMKTIDEEIGDLKQNLVTEEELISAKNRMKVSIIRDMNSNRGLLMNLLSSEVLHGSWQNVFDELEEIEQISAQDIKSIVNDYLVRSNRTVARIEKKEEVKK